MVASLLLPTADSFGNLAGMLVGKTVKVTRGAAVAAANVRGVATYVDATGDLAVAAITDMAFLAGIGAALAMIPLAMVTEATRTNQPSETLIQNAYEVLNVAASLFNEVEGATTHLKLQRLDVGPLAPELAKRLATPSARLDLDVVIPGYPNGKLSFVAVSRA